MSEQSFPKAYCLKHKRLMEALFSSGVRLFKHPVLVLWKEVELSEDVPFQVVFSAPKKHYKRAVTRNKIKRRMREAFRINSLALKSKLKASGKQVVIAFVMVGSDNISFDLIQDKIVLHLQSIEDQIA